MPQAVIVARMAARQGHYFKVQPWQEHLQRTLKQAAHMLIVQASMLQSQFDSLEEPCREEREVVTVSCSGEAREEVLARTLAVLGVV